MMPRLRVVVDRNYFFGVVKLTFFEIYNLYFPFSSLKKIYLSRGVKKQPIRGLNKMFSASFERLIRKRSDDNNLSGCAADNYLSRLITIFPFFWSLTILSPR